MSEYWRNLSERITHPVQTKNKRPDTTDVELNFLKNYVTQQSEVIDIGSGSGLIVNRLASLVNQIIAVEKFEGFTKFIDQTSNVLVINADLKGFKIRREFDLVLATGVFQCFNQQDALNLYRNCFDMTSTNGFFIARTHCSLEKDIIVDGFSQELKANYFAEYRNFEEEMERIKSVGFKTVYFYDFLPDTLNVWDNSRHFYFVCKK